ncbi:ABC transporter ATP-binding protein [Paenibacillus psychroresistens]|uniref:ABC transporter ATP-binding protein n=1 Tax=Paenibacillus psychroresistens TaxID=1778678 RepID=A0A6B8RIA8_9BACL|nr:ABC transporter ATP-binding protein [Paenibacillus psychroresistens]QGQ95809.1 ABC transporter ATP-binding protein [Paenibacillus psychroresistens]
MKHKKWIFALIKEDRWSYVLAFVLLVAESVLFLAMAGLQKFIIDDVFINGHYNELTRIIAAFALVFLFYAMIFTWAPYTFHKNEFTLYTRLCGKLMQRLYKFPIGRLQNERTAKYVHYFTNDAAQASRLVGTELPRMLQQALMAVILMIVIGNINVKMLLVILVLTTGFILIGKYFSPRLRKVSKEVQDNKTKLLIHIEEGVSSTREVISYNRTRWEKGIYDGLFASFYEKVMKEGSIVNKQLLSSNPIKWGVTLFVLGFGGYELMKGNMTLGLFVVVYQYSTTLMDSLNTFFQYIMNASSHLAYLDRLSEVLEGESIKDGDKRLSEPVETLAFEGLSFAYRSGTPLILDDMSLDLPMGGKIAFVGASGGGKSTISQLLIRFFEPKSGQILVNGQPLSDYKREDWTKKVDIVFQDPYLIPDTIRTNLTLGRESISDEQLEAMCRVAQIHDVIQQLPDGYETIIGERGITLSGGQRQRLSLARAFLANPEILILDEATSALDLETERLVQRGLDELRVGRTTIIIAHRLSTIINADQIYVIDRGKVIEMGSHEQLMVGDTAYKRLVYAEEKLQHIA